MRRIVLLLLITMSIVLSGCTPTEAHRIYTVCQYEDGTYIAYNDIGEFVQYKDNATLPHSGAGVTAKPMLSFHPKVGTFSITPTDIPNKYKASLESVENYVGVLLNESESTLDIVFCSWRDLEIFIHSAEWHCRVLWSINGDLRIYFIDNYNNAVEPLYLNEEI